MVLYTLSTCLSIFLNILVYFELKRLRSKQGQAEGANSRAKKEAFITVFCLSLASIVCRLPLPLVGMLLITIIENIYGYSVMCWSMVTVVFLLYLVFVVDPVIYLIRMPDIRAIITKFINCTLGMGKVRKSSIRLTSRNMSMGDTAITVQSSLL